MSIDLTPEQQKKIARFKAVSEGGLVALLQFFDELEAKIEAIKPSLDKDLQDRLDQFEENLPDFNKIMATIRGLPGNPGKDATIDYPFVIAEVLKQIPPAEKPEAVDYKRIIDSVVAQLPPPKDAEALPIDYEYIIASVKGQLVIPSLEAMVQALRMKLPELSAEIRDSLESLPEGERLRAEFIDDLEELFKKWATKYNVGGKPIFVGGGSGGGRIVRSYDLSSSLNGVLKTFSLPSVWRVISVHASSFPNALRDGVDYTWTSTDITFTNEITAAATLATGQTVVVVYSE